MNSIINKTDTISVCGDTVFLEIDGVLPAWSYYCFKLLVEALGTKLGSLDYCFLSSSSSLIGIYQMVVLVHNIIKFCAGNNCLKGELEKYMIRRSVKTVHRGSDLRLTSMPYPFSYLLFPNVRQNSRALDIGLWKSSDALRTSPGNLRTSFGSPRKLGARTWVRGAAHELKPSPLDLTLEHILNTSAVLSSKVQFSLGLTALLHYAFS
ncbi:hypothetical protein C8R48DRAFT_677476 [Suillus tomentosus]|nr:hypothetical protein C8R48DRAFT_677476 [Suillus tomentosus]